ncbi:hypothetical protein GGD38_000077 [Chitinophagaceae bacterium OAS944]|nr:hypothetical protein [Chitinophagaceae bacterium OAS944]
MIYSIADGIIVLWISIWPSVRYQVHGPEHSFFGDITFSNEFSTEIYSPFVLLHFIRTSLITRWAVLSVLLIIRMMSSISTMYLGAGMRQGSRPFFCSRYTSATLSATYFTISAILLGLKIGRFGSFGILVSLFTGW